jgi:ribosomal-protein-alanine N-acetyltransferase
MSLIAETERLELRNLSSGDAMFLHQLTSDADVMKYFPKVLSRDETSAMLQQVLEQYAKYGYCFWKVMRKPTAEFVGIAGILHQEIEGNVEAEVAYRIAKKQWNNGYATEAAAACVKFARTTLGKTRLISIIHPQNRPSIRVAQKLGAQKERPISFVGTEHDVYVY